MSPKKPEFKRVNFPGKKERFYGFLLVVLILSFAAYRYGSPAKAGRVVVLNKHKGVCWVGSREPIIGGEFQKLERIGVSHISQTPFGWQPAIDLPELKFEKDHSRMWWGEKLEGIKATLDSSGNHGITNMLKPHIWVKGSWPGAIEMQSEEDWKTWFLAYSEFIMYYADFAEKQQIPFLCIGTELEKTSHRENDWRQLIRDIRVIYHGKLLYAANFTEFSHVQFWDALDFIGIQAYFPLSERLSPVLKELIKNWNRHLSGIEKVQRKYSLPVIFTEIGYCNTNNAAIEPWVWPSERKTALISEETQALCYKAFFETAWEKDWLAGVYFWKWYPGNPERSPDFTPQNKMAQHIMKEYFKTSL